MSTTRPRRTTRSTTAPPTPPDEWGGQRPTEIHGTCTICGAILHEPDLHAAWHVDHP